MLSGSLERSVTGVAAAFAAATAVVLHAISPSV
jgi:hypothetical protein